MTLLLFQPPADNERGPSYLEGLIAGWVAMTVEAIDGCGCGVCGGKETGRFVSADFGGSGDVVASAGEVGECAEITAGDVPGTGAANGIGWAGTRLLKGKGGWREADREHEESRLGETGHIGRLDTGAGLLSE